jgi:MFS family permease
VIGMALSPDLATFGFAATAMGLSLSIYHPAGTAWISHALPTSGRVFAVHGMAGNLGVAGASVLVGTLGALFGWRWALGLLALLGFGLGARVLAVSSLPVEIARRDPATGGQRSSFILLLVAVAFMGMVYRGMTTFLPKLFALTYAGATADGAAVTAGGTAFGGLLTTLALLMGLAGMWVSGRMSDGGTGMTRVFLIGAVMQAPALVLMGWAGSWTLLPLAMIVAFFHFFTQPPGNQMVASFTPPELRGVGYGLFFFVSFGIGSLGATIGGWASERAGLAPTFSYLALLLVPAVIAVMTLEFIRRPRVAGAGVG